MQNWHLYQILARELQEDLMRQACCASLARPARRPWWNGLVDRFLIALGGLLVDAGERLRAMSVACGNCAE
jgi:hypothetical protein